MSLEKARPAVCTDNPPPMDAVAGGVLFLEAKLWGFLRLRIPRLRPYALVAEGLLR